MAFCYNQFFRPYHNSSRHLHIMPSGHFAPLPHTIPRGLHRFRTHRAKTTCHRHVLSPPGHGDRRAALCDISSTYMPPGCILMGRHGIHALTNPDGLPVALLAGLFACQRTMVYSILPCSARTSRRTAPGRATPFPHCNTPALFCCALACARTGTLP